ncbi:MAG: glycosyltransferase family 4 protein [Candidatus Eisenbacteria bacterium]|nr:glycosyltransferase family 4 protein [Candidatus Eisenbacteria bacterium]
MEVEAVRDGAGQDGAGQNEPARTARERPLRIHFVGAKGIPATFGGVEHAVEEIGARLAARGHRVVVHCRSHYTPAGLDTWRGMELRRETAVRTKRLDTLSHTFVGLAAAAPEPPDVIGLHNYPNGVLAGVGRLARIPVVLHLHGFEWGLGKWNRLDKALLRALLRPATAAPTALTSVSRSQARFVREATGRRVVHIPNGVDPPAWIGDGGDAGGVGAIPLPADLRLERDGYLLCVSRLVPQKGVEHLIRAYRIARLPLPLVLVGDHNHAPEYAAKLRAEAGDDPGIRFAGYRFGDELWSLYAGCRLFVLPSESEGMPLVLLEAMAARCATIATRIPEIEDVGSDAIAYFDLGDAEDLSLIHI